MGKETEETSFDNSPESSSVLMNSSRISVNSNEEFGSPVKSLQNGLGSLASDQLPRNSIHNSKTGLNLKELPSDSVNNSESKEFSGDSLNSPIDGFSSRDSSGNALDELNESDNLKEDQTHAHLRKELGLLDGIGVIVGLIVGSGIFISPTGVIRYTGSVGMALVVWMGTGLVTLIGALCYAELGTSIPKSGGDYAYINEAYGGLPSFLYLWVSLLIIMPTSNTVVALVFSNYILQPFFPNCDAPPDTAVRLIAAVIISLLTWVNCTNVRTATKIQDAFTVTKIFALLLIICTGFYHLCTGNTQNYQNAFEGTNWNVFSIATASYQGVFAFAGWNCLNFVVEELRNPYKNLPRAIWISLPLVTIIYFLTNVAYFSVLSPNEVLSSSAVAVTFGNRTLGHFAWIIPLFVACSTFGSLNASIFSSSRIFFVGARQGHLPEALSLVSVTHRTPIASLIFMAIISVLMLVSSKVEVLINYVSFAESIFVFVSITALLYLRHKYPKKRRPIKVWLALPVTFLLVCVFLLVLPIIERPIELGVALIVILSGIPVYWFCIIKNKPDSSINTFMRYFTKKLQILTKCLPDEKRD